MTELFIHALWDWRGAIASPYGPENPVTRHVLLTIALHMSPAGDSAFPTVDRLVAETGLARRTVIAHTALAEQTGWIGKRDRTEKSGQGWRRIEYIPLIPAGVEEQVKAWREAARTAWQQRGAPPAPPQRGAPPAPASVDNSEGGARDAEGGASDGKKVVHQGNLNTSVNSSIKEGQPPVDKSESKPLRSLAVQEFHRQKQEKAEKRARQETPPPTPEKQPEEAT